MLTGLLYVAVVAMWAAVLLPRWLGASDRHRDKKSMARFRRSLTSMSKATSRRSHRSHDVCVTGGRRVGRVDTSPDDGAIDRHLDHAVDPFVGTVEDTDRRRARYHQKRARARAGSATRRRRTGATLAAVTLLATVVALLGLVPWMLPAATAITLAAFVYLARAQSKAAAARRHRNARPTYEPSLPASEATPTWAPVASPEPRYMREPKATQFPRELDSTENGPWTAERMLEQAAALRTGDVDEEIGVEELAYPDYYATPRAVNE